MTASSFTRIHWLWEKALARWDRLASLAWRPYSRLYLCGDSAQWVLDEEAREWAAVAKRLGIRARWGRSFPEVPSQCAWFSSLDQFLQSPLRESNWRLAASYFHGTPGTGEPEFDRRYQAFCDCHEQISRVHVSNRAFRDVVLNTGINADKVHLIPIGINLSFFHQQTSSSRHLARARFGLPASTVVVGSFQKDGIGWGEGREPKRVKGPDVLLKALEILHTRIRDLFVLLSGPARGFVKAGLDRRGIPYRHVFVRKYSEVGQLYQCLDLYIVASREEGGPKAVLESMGSGVPLVATRVGVAADLVRHGENGWLAEVEDAEGLAYWAQVALESNAVLNTLRAKARATAEANTYEAQTPLWREFMKGFVES